MGKISQIQPMGHNFPLLVQSKGYRKCNGGTILSPTKAYCPH